MFPPKELRPKISSHFTKLVESYELLFADITDEEGGVFKNKELVAHFELKKENFNNEHSLLIGETSEHPVTCEILFRMDQIGAHTMNIFQAYITVDF